MNQAILSALIGLVGAINNNGKTDDTDHIIRAALLNEGDVDWVEKIHEEKYRISPNCASCQYPCGNTSDYPLKSFEEWTDEQRLLKEEIMTELQRISRASRQEEELPALVYKAISFIGYDLIDESYRKLLEELKTW